MAAVLFVLLAMLIPGSAHAGVALGYVAELASVNSAGVQETGRTLGTGSLSDDGRYVAFWSEGNNMSAVDADPWADLFMRDRQTGETFLVTRAFDGSPALTGGSFDFQTGQSSDGRYLLYDSGDYNLVQGDTNQHDDVFVWDRQTGTNIRVSIASDGSQGDGHSLDPSISDDGTKILFRSSSLNFTDAGTIGIYNLYLRDLSAGTTTLVSYDETGTPLLQASAAMISGNGRYVVYESSHTIYRRDLQTATTTIVGLDTDNAQVDSFGPVSISDDGHVISFVRRTDFALVVRNLTTNTTTVVSDPPPGKTWGQDYPLHGAVSGDGTTFSFDAQLPYGVRAVYQRDLATNTLTLVSKSTSGQIPNGDSTVPSMSDDGRTVVWLSDASNLVVGDTNKFFDVFVGSPDTTSPVITRPPTPRLVARTTTGLNTIPVTVSWSAHDPNGVCLYTLEGSVNGSAYAPVPLGSPTTRSQTFAYPTGADTRQYRVDATDCLGNPASQAAGPILTAGRYQEGNAHIRYKGAWHRGSSKAYVAGHDRYTTQKGASAKVRLTGRSVAWVAPTSSKRGSANVYLDGVQVAPVSLTTATAHKRRLVYAKTFATSGAHTLRIINRGTRRIDLDEILILR